MTESYLLQIFVFILAAIITVPLSKRFKLGSIIGYLVAGIAIGPQGIKVVDNAADVMHFAEFGVVLLLFIIGLELKIRRLWEMRISIFGVGTLQVVITGLVVFGLGQLTSFSNNILFILALALPLSSTAIALQIMTEKRYLSTPAGKLGFAVLLFQDIAVIPILAIIPFLVPEAGHGEKPLWLQLVLVFGVIGLFLVVGRYLIRHAFRQIAKTESRELFTAFSLAIVIGASLLMHTVDVSMALGTFLAGVLLADSEYRHQLESDIEPFKGLLLGLFFISVGMTIDFKILHANWISILSMAVAIVVVKFVILFLIGKISRLDIKQSILFGLLLSQGGEFAFVILNAGNIPIETVNYMVLVVVISMFITPFLILFFEKKIATKFDVVNIKSKELDFEPQHKKIIIAGFGRFGQIIWQLLLAHDIHVTVIDHNPDQIEFARRYGVKLFYGDATRLDLLEKAGAKSASLIILAIDDRNATNHAVEIIKSNFPNLGILARAWDVNHVYELKDRGVEVMKREVFDASLALAEDALKILGISADQTKQATEICRAHSEKFLDISYKARHEDKDLISTTIEAHNAFVDAIKSNKS